MIAPWPTTNSERLADYRVFTIRRDHKTSPRTGQPHDFFVLDCPDWVNVIALTRDRQLIMVEQFRHGTNTVELEIPGGVMDPGDESPIATGIRELREETGYEGEMARRLAGVASNPALFSNTCHTILIEHCTLRHPLELDQTEDVANRLVPVDEIPALVATGRIRHSLVVVALYYFELHRRGLLA